MDARRRQILEDMGITVWTQRVSAPAHVSAPAQVPTAQRAPEAAPSGARRAPAPPQTSEALEVCALGVTGVLLFTEGVASAYRLLYTDFLRAASGDWQANPAVLRFVWPARGTAGSAVEALGAFVDKQTDDFSARRRFVVATLAARFAGLDGEFEVVPAPPQLDDPAEKRKLWRRIRTRSG